jgi:hypothetical protein
LNPKSLLARSLHASRSKKTLLPDNRQQFSTVRQAAPWGRYLAADHGAAGGFPASGTRERLAVPPQSHAQGCALSMIVKHPSIERMSRRNKQWF